MKKKIASLAILALLLVNCKRGEGEAPIKSEFIDGIQHVYNSGEPLIGTTPLEITEILRVDPFQIDQENPPLFQAAVKDDQGNLYLADLQNVALYKFNSGGRFVARFLGKGQGPGEFPRLGDIQIVDDRLWILGTWPLKIAEFTLDGQFINEWMFRTFQNYYLRTRVIDEDRFLTVSYRGNAGSEDRVRVSAFIDSKEEFLTPFYEDKNAGIFRIRTGQQEGPAIASTNPLIAADIHHALDRDSGTVFVCNNRDYEILAKNLDGTTRFVIRKTCVKIGLNEAAQEGVLQSIAPRIAPEAKQTAKEQLPPTLNVIWEMAVLPSGYLAVSRITGLESVEIDLFDREGRLLYTILPSAEIPDLRNVTFFGNTVGIIFEGEEKNLFVECRVKNLEGIGD